MASRTKLDAPRNNDDTSGGDRRLAFAFKTCLAASPRRRRAKIVIAQHPRRSSPLPIDADLYKWRHLIENFFGKLKDFKRIAMRADKTDKSFKAAIYLAAAVTNSR
jgi:transposase